MVYGFTLLIYPNRNNNSHQELASASESIVKEFPMNANGEAVLVINKQTNDYIHHSVSGDWLIVSKGWFYDNESPHKEIIKHLHFEDNNLIHALSSINGQYSYIALNLSTGKILVVTDPCRLHSIFKYEVKNFMCLSSSLFGIKKLFPNDYLRADKVNKEYILRYGYPISGATVYEDVIEFADRKIFVGNILNSNKLKSYDRAEPLIKGIKNYEGSLENELYERLLLSCKKQLGSATRVGVLLGGFDSALIASILCRFNVEVKTYSFSYEDSSLNQPFVEELASKLEIEHEWVKITPEVIKEGLEQYEVYASKPTLWMNYVCQTQHVCKQMLRDGVQVIFSGDGCDSLFLGYPNTHRRGNIYKKLPVIGKKTSSTLYTFLKQLRIEYIFGHIARVMLSMIDAARFSEESRPLRTFQVFGQLSYKELTHAEMKYINEQETYLGKLQDQIKALTFERKIYYCKSLISPNRAKIVSSSDITGINIFSPYLDPDLINFAKNIPDDKFRPINNEAPKEGKHLLMTMAQGYKLLPREIIYQPKIAAIKSPIDKWLADELKCFILEKISDLPFSYNQKYISSLLEEKYFEKLYKNNFSNDGVVSIAISLLVTYASFFK